MDTPIGFITLREAVDIVGAKVVGKQWRPMAEIVSEIIAAKQKEKPRIDAINARVRTYAEVHKRVQPEAQIDLEAEALTLIQIQVQAEAQYEAIQRTDVDRVINLVAEQCEAGEIAAAYRSIAGADPLDRAVWRMPHWRSFFATGTINLDLSLLDDKLRPDPNGREARCTREMFLRRRDVEHLVQELSAPGGRAGAPVKWDWDDYKQKFMQLWQENGDFRSPEDQVPGWNSKAAAAETLTDYIQLRCGDNLPHEKTVQTYVGRWIKEIDNGA